MAALDAIVRTTVGEWGGDRKSGRIKNDNVSLDTPKKPEHGNTNTYALRKLRKA